MIYLVSAVSCFILLWKIHFEDFNRITVGEVLPRLGFSLIPFINTVAVTVMGALVVCAIIGDKLQESGVLDKVVYKQKDGK